MTNISIISKCSLVFTAILMSSTAMARTAPTITNIDVQFSHIYQGGHDNLTATATGSGLEYIWTETSSPKYLGTIANSKYLHIAPRAVALPPSVAKHTINLELVVKDQNGVFSTPKTASVEVVQDECHQITPSVLVNLFDVTMVRTNSPATLSLDHPQLAQLMTIDLTDRQTRNPLLKGIFSTYDFYDLGPGPLSPTASGVHLQKSNDQREWGPCWNGQNFSYLCNGVSISREEWKTTSFRINHWYKLRATIQPVTTAGGGSRQECRSEEVFFRLPAVSNSFLTPRPMEISDGTQTLPVRQIGLSRIGLPTSLGASQVIGSVTVTPVSRSVPSLSSPALTGPTVSQKAPIEKTKPKDTAFPAQKLENSTKLKR